MVPESSWTRTRTRGERERELRCGSERWAEWRFRCSEVVTSNSGDGREQGCFTSLAPRIRDEVSAVRVRRVMSEEAQKGNHVHTGKMA